MHLEGGCRTTAMGILPHRDVEQALKLSMSVDVPFWPQLPRLSFFDDMYAQICEGFPGVRVDPGAREIVFDRDRFHQELAVLFERWEELETFQLSNRYSQTFHRFMDEDLEAYRHVRGQVIGPVSFGLCILDEGDRPIIYDDDVRSILFPFIQKKLNSQYAQLKEKHPSPLVWVDEPGLEALFSAFTGYTDERARRDYHGFLEEVCGPRGVHLCGNPDWSFLLDLDLDVLSMDALANGEVLVRYADEIRRFIEGGGIISWGVVPTLTEELDAESLRSMVTHLEELWGYLAGRGMDIDEILDRSWLAPARCCLINLDGADSVQQSFTLLREIAETVRDKYGL